MLAAAIVAPKAPVPKLTNIAETPSSRPCLLSRGRIEVRPTYMLSCLLIIHLHSYGLTSWFGHKETVVKRSLHGTHRRNGAGQWKDGDPQILLPKWQAFAGRPPSRNACKNRELDEGASRRPDCTRTERAVEAGEIARMLWFQASMSKSVVLPAHALIWVL